MIRMEQVSGDEIIGSISLPGLTVTLERKTKWLGQLGSGIGVPS
jgi:hypothetical protein